jgi:TetR/AcrR family transcriptional regulator
MAASHKDTNAAEINLLDSALALFSEKGYEGTSIREIIQGAGVTRPVLYYYFENKEDLFTRLVEENFEVLLTAMEEITKSGGDCRDRLRAIMQKTFALTEDHLDVVRLILQVFFAPPQCGPDLSKEDLAPKRFRIVQELMQEGLDNNELSGGDARSLALIYLGVMDMHIMAKSDRPETKLTPELGASLADFFLHGAHYTATPKTNITSPLYSEQVAPSAG